MTGSVTIVSDPLEIFNCPSDVAVTANIVGCQAAVSWTLPIVNCSGATFTSTHNSGDVFSAGTTTVTYTASNTFGEMATCSFNVTVKNDMAVIIEEVSGPSCYDSLDGHALIAVTGGVTPYKYKWSYNGKADFANQEDLFQIGQGTYDITVADALGCTVKNSFTVDQPEPLKIKTEIVDIGDGKMIDPWPVVQPHIHIAGRWMIKIITVLTKTLVCTKPGYTPLM